MYMYMCTFNACTIIESRCRGVYVCVCVCVCVCACACVCERERERGGEGERQLECILSFLHVRSTSASMCETLYTQS